MMLVIVVFILAVVLFYRALGDLRRSGGKAVVPERKAPQQLTQTLEYADRLFRERRFLPAEKAYLAVLKIDHRNTHSYTRLGMIYTRLKNYGDAIECFQIASQMKPSAANFHNLGLAYYENKNYIKAIAALEKSIMFEPSAERYLSLSRVYQKLANWSKATTSAEKAVELAPTDEHKQALAAVYKLAGQPNRAQQVLAAPAASPKPTHRDMPGL